MAPLLNLLRSTYDVQVHTPEEGRGLWTVSKVSSEKNTIGSLDFIRRVTRLGEPWYLVANSFGNRVAVEILRPHGGNHTDRSGGSSSSSSSSGSGSGNSSGASDKVPDSDNGTHLVLSTAELPRGLVCLGLPLYAKSKTRDLDERALHFRRSFPHGLPVLLCSGEKDTCINGAAPQGGSTREALLREQSCTWACAVTTEVHVVPGGSHGVFDGSAKEPALDAAYEAIFSFLRAC